MAISKAPLARRLQQQRPGNTSADFSTTQLPSTMSQGALGGFIAGGGVSLNGGAAPRPTTPKYQPGEFSYQSPVANQQPDYQNVNDFDFDRQYAEGTDQLGRQLAQARSQYDMANQEDEENYTRTTRDLTNEAQQVFDRNADQLASQGILRSGIAVNQMGNIGQGYQRQLDAINAQRNSGRTGRETQFNSVQQQIQNELARLSQERTRRQQAIEQQRAQQQAAAQAQQEAAERSRLAMPEMFGGGGGGQEQAVNNAQRYMVYAGNDPNQGGAYIGQNNGGMSLEEAQAMAAARGGNFRVEALTAPIVGEDVYGRGGTPSPVPTTVTRSIRPVSRPGARYH